MSNDDFPSDDVINQLAEEAEAAATRPVVIRILASMWHKSPFDGQWLVEYDPSRPGIDPQGTPMLAHVVTTSDRSKAMRLPTWIAAHSLWCQESDTVREDGMRDRPLTAFAICIEPDDDDEGD
jgi:hypothetical protein